MKKNLLLMIGLLVTSLSWADIKVVYHLSEGIPQASRAIGNIRNHLAADPKVKIVVVAHGLGIDFLLDGAVNQMDQAFAGVSRLQQHLGGPQNLDRQVVDGGQSGASRCGRGGHIASQARLRLFASLSWLVDANHPLIFIEENP